MQKKKNPGRAPKGVKLFHVNDNNETNNNETNNNIINKNVKYVIVINITATSVITYNIKKKTHKWLHSNCAMLSQWHFSVDMWHKSELLKQRAVQELQFVKRTVYEKNKNRESQSKFNR